MSKIRIYLPSHLQFIAHSLNQIALKHNVISTSLYVCACPVIQVSGVTLVCWASYVAYIIKGHKAMVFACNVSRGTNV